MCLKTLMTIKHEFSFNIFVLKYYFKLFFFNFFVVLSASKDSSLDTCAFAGKPHKIVLHSGHVPKGLSSRMGMQTQCIWPGSGTPAQLLWVSWSRSSSRRSLDELESRQLHHSGHLTGFMRVFVGC